MLQPDNAILCPSFYSDKDDSYLKTIIPYMKVLSECADVRPKLKEFSKIMTAQNNISREIGNI